MTEDQKLIIKAEDMLKDWTGIGYLWTPSEDDSEFWNDAACILQQLVAEHEGWTRVSARKSRT